MIVEKSIIEKCKENDSSAQRFIFEQYASTMLGLCMRYVKDRDTAEDIVQEGFITIFTKISQFRGSGSFEGWMKRIMINTALSHLRGKDREPAKFSIETFFNIKSPDDDNEEKEYFDDETDQTELPDFSQQEIFEVLSSLPVGFRTIFNMFALDGLKHREIAEILKISIGTSKSQYLRARKKLKNLLLKLRKT